ncbi:TOBE domain protein [Arcobacter nitrofigilis DSM 7299]|uniref:TOBE domain protein n=1 Tax=Arcobacter nitrofigilis (strain ATCC 33309 / DSM 7299 / CCUG 15893 / LMG 7604 / NCTC 12251 / CI) TaxID=572480 RepID=D5V3K2_ARCNC|nr:TOBE domain-containing protein [Arcobacter nitrofigilis]ADG91713.1 TOBE domain protein [Arcobacter nitrofigilis DSM 7299]
MNKIEAIISQIDNIDNLNIVQFDFLGIKLKMMSLDLNENIKIGQNVILVAKATNIILARDFKGMISFSNQINGKIDNIENGKLLCSVTIKAEDSYFQSIITQASAKKMNLKKDDEINIFIKASDLSIEEIINV